MHHDAFAILDALKSTLDEHRPLARDLFRSLRKDIVLRYTYHSNAIEGNPLTLTETKVVLEDGLTIGGKLLRNHLEVVNHADAITHLEDLAKKNVLLDDSGLKDLHQLVLRGLDNEAGRYRGCNVIITGARHTPPDHHLVDEHMQNFLIGTVARPRSFIPWRGQPGCMPTWSSSIPFGTATVGLRGLP